MKKYIISFRYLEVADPELGIKIRAKIESLSPDTWIHVLENQLLVQSEKNIEEIYSYLSSELANVRISIARFEEIFINDGFMSELESRNY